MLHTYLNAFVTLFVIIDPVALVPIFMGLTQRMTSHERSKSAGKACWISVILLLLFAVGGEALLNLMGISDAAFQIAGGFLLMIASVEMVVAHHTGLTSTTLPEQKEASFSRDITVFPLAIPLISGPGALTTVILFMQEAENSLLDQCILVGIVILVIGITFVFLKMAHHIQKLLGITGSNVVTRVFGIILTALATQFIITGIKSAFF
ncbi:MAG: MarC family protein [Alphaproteobacteria bacterium]|nr:MarC family protein [Alphaproteobacteria bacterium]